MRTFGEINASVTSVPISGGSSIGSRTDLLLPDDIYNTENANSPAKAASVEERYRALMALFGEKSPQIIMPATPVAYGDLYHKIVKANDSAVFRIPMWPDDYPLPTPPITRKQARQLHADCFWPANTTPVKIAKIFNLGKPSWLAAQFMVKPQLAGSSMFNVDNVTIAPSVEPSQDFWRRFDKGGAMIVAIDPSTGLQSRQDGDDTVMLVVGFEPESRTWHVYDGWGTTNFTPSDISSNWQRLLHKWKIVKNKQMPGTYLPTYVETIGSYISILGDLRYQQIPDASVLCQRKRINKEDKIVGMVGAVVNNKKLVVHHSSVSDMVLKQIRQYGAAIHDDYIDALAMALLVMADSDPALSAVKENLPEMEYENAREIRGE